MTLPADMWIGLEWIGTIWQRGDGTSAGGGAASNSSNAAYYHYASTHVRSRRLADCGCPCLPPHAAECLPVADGAAARAPQVDAMNTVTNRCGKATNTGA
jgi:hypothetical protein